MDSATSATCVMFPKAVTKSLHSKARCSLPSFKLQCCSWLRCCFTSSSVSFLAGIQCLQCVVNVKSMRPGKGSRQVCLAHEGFHVACGGEFLYGSCSVPSQNARCTTPHGVRRREKENSRHSVWCRPYRRIYREIDAGKAGHRDYRRDRFRSGESRARPGGSGGRLG